MRLLITGGAGFIGSSFLQLFVPRFPEHHFLNADAWTHAANPLSVQNLERYSNYSNLQLDLRNYLATSKAVNDYQPNWIIHFAAQTHVDRSIKFPAETIECNVNGTLHLLEAARHAWSSFEGKKFHHVSTDEVYGSLGESGAFSECTPYDPSSPYSASKAASDHLVRAYYRTFGLPVTLSNCSNNYGPRQFPEKLIPLMILNSSRDKALPIYGTGHNVRDWLYVDDHNEAIWQILERGGLGETYNIGGKTEKTNLEVVKTIVRLVAEETGTNPELKEQLITFVEDRPGHDFRYAIDCSKIESELGWQPRHNFEQGLRDTVRWYLSNSEWVESVLSGSYLEWIAAHYQGVVSQ